jgi:hypothetical protein
MISDPFVLHRIFDIVCLASNTWQKEGLRWTVIMQIANHANSHTHRKSSKLAQNFLAGLFNTRTLCGRIHLLELNALVKYIDTTLEQSKILVNSDYM